MARARNFHLPLSEDLYLKLRDEAGKVGRPATALAREALEEWLHEREQQTVHEQIAAYAQAVAGSRDDLDEELESEAVVQLSQAGS